MKFVGKFLKNNLLILWPIVLTVLTVFFSFQIIDNFNAAGGLYDDTLFVNVADNLRKGNGYTLSLTFPNSVFDIDSKIVISNIGADILIKENPELYRSHSKSPLHFIILAAFLSLTFANPENWIFLSGILSIIISVLFVNTYYFLIKRYFGIHIGIITSLLLVSSFVFLGNVSIGESKNLEFLLIVVSLFFLKPNKMNYILFGVFAGLAILTAQIGFLLILGYGLYLLIHKEFRGLLITVGIWFIVVLPWMVRQFLTFGDFGRTFGIPFSKEISSLIAPIENANTSTISSNILLPNVFSPLELLYKIATPTHLHLELFIIISIFAPIAYFGFRKNIVLNKKRIFFVVFSIAVILIAIFSTDYLEIGKKDIIILEFLAIIGIPIIIFLGIFRKNEQNRFEVILLFLIFVIVLLNYYVSTIIMGLYLPLVFLLYLLTIPLGIKGIKILADKIDSKKYKETMLFAGLFLLVIIFVSIETPTHLTWYNNYSAWVDRPDNEMKIYEWINKYENENAVLMAQYPGLTFMRTGNPVVVTPAEFYEFEYKKALKYIEYYQVDYIISPTGGNSNLWQYFGIEEVLRSGNLSLLHVQELKSELVDLRMKFIESTYNTKELLGYLSLFTSPSTDEEFLELYDKLIVFSKNLESSTDGEVRVIYEIKNEFLREKIKTSEGVGKDFFEQSLINSYKDELDFYEDQDYIDKLRVYEKIIEFDRINKDAWLGKAETLEEMNKSIRAIAAYNFLLKIVNDEESQIIQEKIDELTGNN